MGRVNLLKIALIFVFLLLLFSLPAWTGEFEVLRVYDGDTIKARGCDIEIKVRLVGIDAPETPRRKREPGQPHSQRAKKYLAALILNRTVEIKGYGLGPYNRVLGEVYINGKNINLEMLRAGLAEVYRGKPPRGLNLSPYWEAEKEARRDRRGMWSLREKYMSPTEWRKMNRLR